MPTYPIDIEPEQIVRWLVAEQQTTPSLFKFDTRHTVDVPDIPPRPEYHLGDEEIEDLNEFDVVPTLEVTPAHANDGWRLTITVEGEAGPRVSADEANTAPERQIDVGTFYHQFIRPGRGIVTATAEVQDAVAKRHLISCSTRSWPIATLRDRVDVCRKGRLPTRPLAFGSLTALIGEDHPHLGRGS